ncbi:MULTISPECIES: IS3 family transposase, partial [unclassified Fusobacterium]
MGCTTQGEKAAIVKELKEKGYKLKYLLKTIGIAKSTYYYEIKKVDAVKLRNIKVAKEIRIIFQENKQRYGVRRVHKELENRGIRVNHKRVQRLMHDMGLMGKRPKVKYHSYLGNIGKVAPNIINRDFSASAPLQKWTTDVSQFTFSWGKCYFS